MARARVDESVIAESDSPVVVEGNQYFPPHSVNRDYLESNDAHTTCPWKGEASYYDIVIGEKRLSKAAWYYPDPKPAASEIKDHIAFGSDVQVET